MALSRARVLGKPYMGLESRRKNLTVLPRPKLESASPWAPHLRAWHGTRVAQGVAEVGTLTLEGIWDWVTQGPGKIHEIQDGKDTEKLHLTRPALGSTHLLRPL